MKKSFKWLMGASLLGAAAILAVCSENTTTPTPTPAPTNTAEGEPTNTFISLKGYELKEVSRSVSAATFDLATVLEFYTIKSVDDLLFKSSNEEIATVDSKGVITRKQYGNASISIVPKNEPTSIFKMTVFNIFFTPTEEYLIGKYDSHIDGVEGQPEVLVTIEIKANKQFTITYTAGKVSVGEDTYDVTAQTLNGTFENDGMIKFTITSDTTLRKTFGGQFVYDGDKVTIKAKVPVSDEKTSRMIYLEGLK